ncbi:hypothetical protein ACWD9K_00045 [Streptomyces sp. 900116325]|uniref:hypothetical protein n=1 Tax=Streptomyces sp. 900116325 TaxID=3154295 RepID=UPI0033A88DD1
MKSLIGSMIAIIALFLIVLLLLGSQFGGLEIIVWLVALTASLVFAARHHKRSKKKEDAEGTSV